MKEIFIKSVDHFISDSSVTRPSECKISPKLRVSVAKSPKINRDYTRQDKIAS